MKFCIMKDTITPDVPVYQMGFIGRSHKSEGVHDDIYVKVVLLKSNKNVLLVTFDLCIGDRHFTNELKKELGEKFGFQEDEILITYTHTHSAVGLNGSKIANAIAKGISLDKECINPEDEDLYNDMRYYFMVKEKIFKLIGKCFENLTEGRIFLGKGTSDIGVNRRLMTPEGVKMMPNFNADYDRDLFVFKLVDMEDNIRGVLFSYGCHPTTMSFDNYYISAEWCGFACEHLEKEFDGATAVFLQACAGDVKPKASAADGKFKSCNFEETELVGKQMAKDVSQILKEQKPYEIKLNMRTYLKDARLYSGIMPISELEKIIDNPSTHDTVKKKAIKLIDMIKSGTAKQNINFYISVWYLDDHVKIIGMEGEVLNTIGKRIKNIFNDGKTIALGYSNGVQCYIPNREALEEGGYERDSYLGLGLYGPFIPEIENIIYGNIVTAGIS